MAATDWSEFSQQVNLINRPLMQKRMEILIDLLILAICAILGLITYRFSLLTTDGSLAAAIVGTIIGLINPSWLILLFSFLIAGVIVTKYRFREKKSIGVQEGIKGERGWRNVLSTGSAPLLIAILSLTDINPGIISALFLVAIGTAASDTLASEMGVLSNKTYLITNFRRVKAGTNGGISAYGTFWALIGAFVTSIFGGIFLKAFSSYPSGIYYLFIPGIFGFLGCIIDSILGATLENRGIIGKGAVNLLSALLAVIITYPFL